MRCSYDDSVIRAFIVVALLASCTSAPVAASPTASPAALTSPSPRASAATTERPQPTATVPAEFVSTRLWYTLPDGLFAEPYVVQARFLGDPTATAPTARLRSTARAGSFFSTGDGLYGARIDLAGVAPGEYVVDIVEHLITRDVTVASGSVKVSAPEYVVWTLDFEGDTAGDAELANTAAIADGLRIPMTIMWNPRVWTTTQVTPAAADDMLAWTTGRYAKGDEVALHLHAWTDFVRDAGVTARTAPNWAGRSDGYDVPLTAFDESETAKLLSRALELMKQHGLAAPTTFRAGGLFANAANLRAVAAAGFTVDTSGTPSGAFGRLPLPWTLAKDAQPYHPSADNANVPGALPVLELPNIAGNTYGYTVTSIPQTIRDDLAMIAPVGQVAKERRALTLVSHPGTIDALERPAIELLFKSLEPFRYDRDTGPVRFVTAAQLAQAYR